MVVSHVVRSWTAFQYYVLPVLMYCSPAWNPVAIGKINLIEKVQRRYTKRIGELRHLSYNDRLRSLGVLSLRDRRSYADMVYIYKALHGLVNFPSADMGLIPASSTTRGLSNRLRQRRITTRADGALFCCRAPAMWNRLPAKITSCTSLKTFKQHLFNYFMSFYD